MSLCRKSAVGSQEMVSNTNQKNTCNDSRIKKPLHCSSYKSLSEAFNTTCTAKAQPCSQTPTQLLSTKLGWRSLGVRLAPICIILSRRKRDFFLSVCRSSSEVTRRTFCYILVSQHDFPSSSGNWLVYCH